MASRVSRGIGKGCTARPREIRFDAPALGLPGVRKPNSPPPEHSSGQLRRAPRSMLRMPMANSGPLSDRRSRRCARRGSGRHAVRRRGGGSRRMSARVGAACGGRNRSRNEVASRCDHDTTAMVGSCLQPERHLRAAVGLRHRGHGRICHSLGRLPGVQASDRSGRDGVRRLQAARAARRMARMASAARHSAACVSGRGDCGHDSPRVRSHLARYAASIRSVSRCGGACSCSTAMPS